MPPALQRLVAPLRPYVLHLFLLGYTALVLVADGLLGGHRPQLALGCLGFAVLVACTRFVPPGRRFEVWLCVPVATLFEVYGSLVWGGYTYRLENIPLYVPPGHALVFVFGVTAASLPLVRRNGSLLKRGVVAAATTWALAGVTVLPPLTHRWDVQGLILLPLLVWCVLRSRRGELFAAIWLLTAAIELVGTWAGDWSWAATAPWSGLPSGNPPSSIAAGYAVIDGSVVLLAPPTLAALGALAALVLRIAPVPIVTIVAGDRRRPANRLNDGRATADRSTDRTAAGSDRHRQRRGARRADRPDRCPPHAAGRDRAPEHQKPGGRVLRPRARPRPRGAAAPLAG
jgi:hypothetical protein